MLCRGRAGDAELDVVEVWADRYWRLTAARRGEVLGFCHLEPRRHVPHITDLTGPEARTLGAVLARTTRALREAAGAELVYLYVFGGGVPHLHLHLAAHREGDALSTQLIRGKVVETRLPSGATRIESAEFPPLAAAAHRRFRARLRRALRGEVSRRGTSGRPRGAAGRPKRAR